MGKSFLHDLLSSQFFTVNEMRLCSRICKRHWESLIEPGVKFNMSGIFVAQRRHWEVFLKVDHHRSTHLVMAFEIYSLNYIDSVHCYCCYLSYCWMAWCPFCCRTVVAAGDACWSSRNYCYLWLDYCYSLDTWTASAHVHSRRNQSTRLSFFGDLKKGSPISSVNFFQNFFPVFSLFYRLKQSTCRYENKNCQTIFTDKPWNKRSLSSSKNC